MVNLRDRVDIVRSRRVDYRIISCRQALESNHVLPENKV